MLMSVKNRLMSVYIVLMRVYIVLMIVYIVLMRFYIVLMGVNFVLMRVFTYFVSSVVLDVFIACLFCGNEFIYSVVMRMPRCIYSGNKWSRLFMLQ